MNGFSSPSTRPCRGVVVILWALLLVSIALPAAVFAQDVCDGTLTKLSACPKDADGNVTIGPDGCTAVYADQSFTGASAFALIKIQPKGALCIRDSDVGGGNLVITTSGIVDLGTFAIGSQSTPIGTGSINGTVTVNFTGSRDVGAGGPAETCPDPNFRKGIEVCDKATLRLYGVKGVPLGGALRTDGTHTSWTFLTQPAGPAVFTSANGVASPVLEPDARTIDVADPVDWQTGDWVAIATTSYSPFETEFAQIASVSGSPLTHITLNNPLVFYHFGGADPGPPSPANYNATIATNYGVDERAEVGLISRNIKLTATIPPNDTKSLHWGGEIIIRNKFTEFSIQGTELQKFGKDRLGSYPIHLHKDGVIGAGQTLLVNANSIDHSYNKCITVHSTVNATITNNVCGRAVGQLFYEEIGNEQNIAFNSNLGLGAMSNHFDIDGTSTDSATRAAQRTALIQQYWWPGDNLTNNSQTPAYIGYDGFNIPDVDNPKNPTHGSCTVPDPNLPGSLVLVAGDKRAECTAGEIYDEPSGGFWLVNPATHLDGNSIGGCQGDGKGYWYVPPGVSVDSLKPEPPQFWPKYQSIDFTNNRVHACESGIFAEPEFSVASEQVFPLTGGTATGKSLVTTINGITSTRNRNRGIWLRPNWFNIENARLAMNRDNAALVTAGGFDGATPGDWGLVQGSTFVGISTNNVDRFGPCPYPGVNGPVFQNKITFGGKFGCIDLNPASNDYLSNYYPDPTWNFAGYYTYDGPARVFNDRFVNFIANTTNPIAPYWTAFDQAFVNWLIASGGFGGPNVNLYEGDAAIGWFNANQSSYPVSTTFDGLTFQNVDLRHEVFTDLVNFGSFQDGDKNTAIVDHDGSLTGYSLQAPDGVTPATPDDVFPISLNNLGFNYSSNAADECLAEGAQNLAKETRPTSVISPGDIASLELEAQTPSKFVWFQFTTDDQFGVTGNTQHQDMFLHGRNGNGVWEPKVAGGHGYTISVPSAAPSPNFGVGQPADAGIPPIIDIGLTDARVASLPGSNPRQPNPLYARLGICYAPSLNQNDFTVKRGYKSWGGALGGDKSQTTDLDLTKYWTKLDCHNLDSQNKDYKTNCPGTSVAQINPVTGACDPGGTLTSGKCSYPTIKLEPVDCSSFTTAQADSNFCYNSTTGYLYLYVKQNAFLAEGPSPVGDCLDPSHQSSCQSSCSAGQYQSPVNCSCSTQNPCPNPDSATDPFGFAETYYSCPNEGCPLYRVEVKNASSYKPGPSQCTDPYADGVVPPPQPLPASENLLAVGSTPVTQNIVLGTDGLPHAAPSPTPNCTAGLPGSAPPWSPGGVAAPVNIASYIIFDQVSGGAVSIGGATVYLTSSSGIGQYVAPNLTFGQQYTLTDVRPVSGTCTTNFSVGLDSTTKNPSYTVLTPNKCNMTNPPTGGGQTMTLLPPA